jgi:hypothetical protein
VTCSVDGCDGEATRRDRTLCRVHDHRLTRYGSASATHPRRLPPDAPDKWCPGCEQSKPKSEFGPMKTAYQGLRPRCRECVAREGRERRAAQTPEQRARRAAIERRSRIKTAYGKVGLEADARIRDGHGCDVCGNRTKRMAIDHDHVSGAVRGILCKDCNLVLGWMDDDPERFDALAAYLRKAL